MIKFTYSLVLFFAAFQLSIAQQSLRPDILSIDLKTMNSIDTITNQLSIYPNPASEKVVVSNALALDVTVTIFNIIGDPLKVKTSDAKQIIFDISNLTDGVYIVAFNNGKEIVTQQFVKAR